MQQQKGSCCPQGSWPALNVDYKGKGELLPISDTVCYHIGSSDKVLILMEDIFGAKSARHESVADTFAALGYNVFMPHTLITPFDGDVSEMPKIIESIKGQDWQRMESRFKGLLDYLNEKGYKEFFAAGFCWGLWALFKLAVKYEGFRSIVGFHPSLGVCGIFGDNEKDLVNSIKCPAFFMPASNDPPNVKEGGQWVQLLKGKFGEEKTGAKTFPEQVHGWVVRADVSKQDACRDVEGAIKLANEYFAKF